MCPSCGISICPVWVRSDGVHTDWTYDCHGHKFSAHEDRNALGRIVHTSEYGHGGVVNMRYENTAGREQWVIDASRPQSAPSASYPVFTCLQAPAPYAPKTVNVPAMIPVATTTTTHYPIHYGPHRLAYTYAMSPTPALVPAYPIQPPRTMPTGSLPVYPTPTFCWQTDPNKLAREAAEAAAKRDAALKSAAEAKAHYEAILAKVHEGKDDEWTRYWADMAKYYSQLGHMTEAKAVREKRLGAFNLNNWLGKE